MFTLTVQTAGGKTPSSLAIALDHAVSQGLARVVYVIPFTSILEQRVYVFRGALGSLAGAVLEHYSSFAETRIAAREGRDKLAPRDGKLGRATHRHDRRSVFRKPVCRSTFALSENAQLGSRPELHFDEGGHAKRQPAEYRKCPAEPRKPLASLGFPVNARHVFRMRASSVPSLASDIGGLAPATSINSAPMMESSLNARSI